MQPNIPTPLQVVGEKVTPLLSLCPGIWGCISLILLVPQMFRPLELAVELLPVLIYLFMLAALGPFLAAMREGATLSLWTVGFSSTGFACCQAGARGHMDFRSCSSQA